MTFKDPAFADWALSQFGNCGNEVSHGFTKSRCLTVNFACW
jgi:hypothetical protein